jgi:cytochrome b pre-mRNA-processing protein 3
MFKRSPYEETARLLYERIVGQARRPEFYRECGIPDTLDGRFDVLVLHVFLVMHRLKQDRGRTADLSQALFDILFQDMDESLRELGAGDMGIGRRIRAMAEGFYGRVAAYEEALDAADRSLEDCVRRNLFGSASPVAGQLAALADYIRAEVAALAARETEELLAGELVFGDAPAPEPGPLGGDSRTAEER